MGPFPETRPSLLVRIRDSTDSVAWNDFVKIYAPLVYWYARRRGLQDADAADVSQAVLQSVARSIAGFQYDPAKGTFRSWLFTVARNQVAKLAHKKKRSPVISGEAAIQVANQIDHASDEEHWNREHERHLFHWAAEEARDEFQETTWQAFWKVVVEGHTVADTSASLGMTTGAIYVAKSRVTARLRQLIQGVEGS